MARRSAESLSIAAVSIPVRPDPPKDLSAHQKQVWKDVTATKPPEWFESDCFPLLRAYCVAAERHLELGKKIKKLGMNDPEVKDYLRLEESQAKTLGTLGAKMRLTQQSRYTPLSAATADKKAKGGNKPWQE